MTHAIPWLLLALLGACKQVPPPPMPNRSFTDTTPCNGYTTVDPRLVTNIFVNPHPWKAISPESAGIVLVDMVSLTTTSGDFIFSDVVHADKIRQTFEHCKLSLRTLQVTGVAGSIGEHYLFTPQRDVLASLDSGFGARIGAADVAATAIFRPAYDTDAYNPFDREAPDGPKASTGRQGQSGGYASGGAAGSRGSTGNDGADGSDGRNGSTPGMSGGAGGAGGAGAAGAAGAAGSGGGGGSGSVAGSAGNSGRVGSYGSSGRGGGSMYCSNRPGSSGPSGQGVRPQTKEGG